MFNKNIKSLADRLTNYQRQFKSAVGVADLQNNEFRIPGGIEGEFSPITVGEKAVIGEIRIQEWNCSEKDNSVFKARVTTASLVFIHSMEASDRCPLLNKFSSNFYTTAFLSWICGGWKLKSETAEEVVFAIYAPTNPPVCLATIAFKKGETPVLGEPVVDSESCVELFNPSNPKGILREKVGHYAFSLLDVPKYIFEEKKLIAAKNLNTSPKEVEVILPQITIDPF